MAPNDPKFQAELLDIFKFIHWRIPDPGPPWLFQLHDKEALVTVALAQLQMEKEVLHAQSKAIDAHIAALNKRKG